MHDLTKLTTAQVIQAMDNAGYPDCEFTDSSFVRFTSDGDAAYVVAFLNERKAELGYVFITQTNGRLAGEF